MQPNIWVDKLREFINYFQMKMGNRASSGKLLLVEVEKII